MELKYKDIFLQNLLNLNNYFHLKIHNQKGHLQMVEHIDLYNLIIHHHYNQFYILKNLHLNYFDYPSLIKKVKYFQMLLYPLFLYNYLSIDQI